MDVEKCQQLSALVDELTTSGETKLDEVKVKALKKICRLSDDYVRQCYHLLLSQLKKDHSEIRLSAFQIIDELFRRSHVFRTSLLEGFQLYLELTLEINPNNPLPLPKAAANKLKERAYQALRAWHEMYSSGYRKLELAFNYLRNCHQVDFDRADHVTALQRHRESEENAIKEVQRSKRIANVMNSVLDSEEDIKSVACQFSMCFNLLVPSQNLFDLAENNESSSKANSDVDNQQSVDELTQEPHADAKIQEHGLLHHRMNINVQVEKQLTIKESEDTTDIIHNLDDLKVLLTMKYSPLVTQWLSILQKSGAKEEHIKHVIDIKQVIQNALQNLNAIRIQRIDGEDSDDDDMIEVPEEVDEVTFLKNSLGMTGKISADEPSTSKLSNMRVKAPVVDYDLDLAYWDNPDELKVPEVLQSDSSRFWISNDRDYTINSSLQEMYSSRRIEFAGKFVPVKWTCRAPLANGRLCPRMDRVKCPFHGKIIPRNPDGSPSNEEDAKRFASLLAKQQKANPDWQNPQYLAELEAQTGLDLKVKKNSRGKKKSKLTDIKKVSDTSRHRLESKVLSRSAVRRVASAMNTLDSKRLKEKFCHSFVATFKE